MGKEKQSCYDIEIIKLKKEMNLTGYVLDVFYVIMPRVAVNAYVFYLTLGQWQSGDF